MSEAAAAPVRRRKRISIFDLMVFGIVGLLVLMAIFGPMIAPDTIYQSNIRNTLKPPSAQHWFGTDDQGRDVFWRVVAGARATLLSSAIIVTCYSFIGIVIATLATAWPRWLDNILMRITDIGLSLPGIVVALGFAAALGPSLQSAVIAKSLTGWPMTARLLRSIMAQTALSPYVTGATVLGASKWRLMTRHILPNSLDILIVKWAGDISTTVLVLAGMSFIGVGAQPPSAEWGAMLAGAKGYVSTAWWAVAGPGLAIALTSIGFGLLGDKLQVMRDPSLRAE